MDSHGRLSRNLCPGIVLLSLTFSRPPDPPKEENDDHGDNEIESDFVEEDDDNDEGEVIEERRNTAIKTRNNKQFNDIEKLQKTLQVMFMTNKKCEKRLIVLKNKRALEKKV